jgi:hypothetical protein
LNSGGTANDHIFTLQTVLNEFAVGAISFEVSASFTGSTNHVFSNVFTVTVTCTPPPGIVITAPANVSYLSLSPASVSGTVDDPKAKITINSIDTPNANGAFSAPIPLAEGKFLPFKRF